MQTNRRDAKSALQRCGESNLPHDDESERCAIAALLHGPYDNGRRLARRAHAGQFFDPMCSWLWRELREALTTWQPRITTETGMNDWMAKRHVAARFRGDFRMRLTRFYERYVWNVGFWWHGDWYIDRVIEAAKIRERIIGSAGLLHKALDDEYFWRIKRCGESQRSGGQGSTRQHRSGRR